MNTENILKAQIMEQEGNQLNQHLELIQQNINELLDVKESLNEIIKPGTKELLANIGKKIYVPVEIKEKRFLIDVGNKVIIEKSPKEAESIINEQLENLEAGKKSVSQQLDDLHARVQLLLDDVAKQNKKKD